MKYFQFSIRQMLIGVFLLAAMFAMGSVYKSWSQQEIDRKYAMYRTLQLMSLLENGQSKAEIEKQFTGMFAIDGAMAEQILNKKPNALPSDLVYGVPIGNAFARFLFFRDERLVGHEMDAAELQNTINTIKLSTPPWYLQYGHWVIGPALVLVLGLFMLVFRWVRPKKQNAT